MHGLGGGSRKTWSKTKERLHFWPKEWLPRDTAFRRARIHTFGYDSSWVNKSSGRVNIHDFGKTFLTQMHESPTMRRTHGTPIILVGHSMGGLVIKKAYMLARNDAAYHTLANRMQAMVFLATPHRGSDSAQLLTNVLRASMGSKAYIIDLQKGSGTTQDINDNFRHVADALKIRTFYESQAMFGNALVVEPESATLGYKNEVSSMLVANHRTICKFDLPSCPTYVEIRNALAALVSDVDHENASVEKDEYRAQIKSLRRYLNVDEEAYDDLIERETQRFPGSCQWILARSAYQSWLDSGASRSPSVSKSTTWSTVSSRDPLEQSETASSDLKPYYILHGAPAMGKSLVATRIIEDLQSRHLGCSYHFFQHGDRVKSTLGGCLRGLAFQMALSNPSIRQKLCGLEDDGVQIEKADGRSIWKKLFLHGVFELHNLPAQYWVLDAIDESNVHSSISSLLSQVPTQFGLRVFMTCRSGPELDKQIYQLRDNVLDDQISIDDTAEDIRNYAVQRAERLPVESEEERLALINAIVGRASGCFLWVSLILEDLQHAYSDSDRSIILNETPSGMTAYYQRTLALMSHEHVRTKKLATSILSWVSSAVRPLTLAELEGALKLDLREGLTSLQRTIESICGSLVRVDRQDRVRMIHETAREYLLRDDLDSEFAVKQSSVHKRLAKVCLDCLTGDEMRIPRGRTAPTSSTIRLGKRSEFADYASLHFSEHTRKSSVDDKEVLLLLDKWCSKQILCWIELCCLMGQLAPIITAAENLKIFLARHAEHHSPIGKQFQIVQRWTIDLLHIATKFGTQLLQRSEGIYRLVPPLCPSETAIATHLSSQGLKIRGLKWSSWDDRISCMDYQSDVKALATSGRFLAVGLSSGMIKIHDIATCQELNTISHGQRVRKLALNLSGSLLASSGISWVRLWETESGDQLWQTKVLHEPLALMFSTEDDTLIAATTRDELLTWPARKDHGRPSRTLYRNVQQQFRQAAEIVSFSTEHKLMAVTTRGQAVSIHDLEEHKESGVCGRNPDVDGECDNSHKSIDHTRAITFNRNPDICLMAVSYMDGGLAVFDPSEAIPEVEIQQVWGDCLASSADGRLLAVGSANGGVIRIYEFETLKMLYKVASTNIAMKQLAFSDDGNYLIDIRGTQCNIWNPAAVVSTLDEADGTDSIPSALEVTGTTAEDVEVSITALAPHPNGALLACGRKDGSISCHSAVTGLSMGHIAVQTKNLTMRHLTWSTDGRYLASADTSATFAVWRTSVLKDGVDVAEKMLEHKSEASVTQLLFSPDGQMLLVSTSDAAFLWAVSDSLQVASVSLNSSNSCRWVQHPTSPELVVAVRPSTATCHSWQDLEKVGEHTALHTDTTQARMVLNAMPNAIAASSAAIELAADRSVQATRSIIVLETSEQEPLSLRSLQAMRHDVQSLAVKNVLGMIGDVLVFLDSSIWVCTYDLSRSDAEIQRHFFLPNEWPSANPHELYCIMKNKDLVYVRRHEVIIMSNGINLT